MPASPVDPRSTNYRARPIPSIARLLTAIAILSLHNHHNVPVVRPLPQPDSVRGNTGADGLQFRINHTWSQDAREQDVFLHSLDPQRPCGSPVIPSWNYCIQQGSFSQLPDNPVYDKIGNPDNHPSRFYGINFMHQSLLAVATDYRALYPAGAKVGYNDISLPWGAMFDINDTWQPKHCGHRWGWEADVRIWNIPAQPFPNRTRLKAIFTDNNFNVEFHTPPPHWHVELPFSTDGLVADEHEPFVRLASDDGRVGAAVQEQPINVTVSSTVTYNAQTQRYTYVYKVRNLPTSTDTVDVFGVRSLLGVETVTAPTHWDAFHPFQGNNNAVAWFCTDPGAPPQGWGDDSVSVYTSAFALDPGDSVSGFTIVSPNPPGTVQYLARKQPPITSANDAVGVQAPPFWSIGATGNTTGPVSPVGVPEEDPISPRRTLLLPAPNPFSKQTTDSFNTLEPADVELSVYDPFGRHVAEVMRERRPPGQHSVTWHALNDTGRSLAAVIYFLQLFLDGKRMEGKTLVLVE